MFLAWRRCSLSVSAKKRPTLCWGRLKVRKFQFSCTLIRNIITLIFLLWLGTSLGTIFLKTKLKVQGNHSREKIISYELEYRSNSGWKIKFLHINQKHRMNQNKISSKNIPPLSVITIYTFSTSNFDHFFKKKSLIFLTKLRFCGQIWLFPLCEFPLCLFILCMSFPQQS